MSSKNQFENHIKSLKGVWTALITPMEFEKDRIYSWIHNDKFARLIDDQIDAGVNGLLILGTTGQGPTMDDEEHFDVVESVIDYINGRVPVMIGAGSNATNQAFNLSKKLSTIDTKIKKTNGMPILLHVTGYYNNPPQKGLYMHFKYLAENLPDTPIIIYNVPGRTSSDINFDEVIELAEKYPNIIGIKYAKPASLDVVKKIVDNTDPERFRVLSGNDDEFYDFLELGAHGIISAAASVIPAGFTEIYKLYKSGEKKKARQKQQDIDDIIKAVYAPNTKNPMALNYMLDSGLRLPLFNIGKGLDMKDEHERKAYEFYAPVRQMIKDAMKNHYDELLPLAKETYENL